MKKIFKFSNLIKVLIVMAVFFRGNLRDYLMMGSTAIWLMINTCLFLEPKIKPLVEKAKIKISEAKISIKEMITEMNNTEAEVEFEEEIEEPKVSEEKTFFKDTQDFLLRNVNFRITEKLRRVYPKVTWSWASDLFDDNGRIKNAQIYTENTGEFNMADVSFQTSGEINFKMLKVAEFKEKECKETEKLSEDDIKTWYDSCAFGIINETINEICSKGYKFMEIEEDGSIYIREQNEKVQCRKIDNMVDKNLWNDFAKYLKKDDIKTKVLNDKLVLSWGGNV